MRALLLGFAILFASSIVADAATTTVPLPCEAKAVRISRDAGTAAFFCSDNSGPVIALPSGKVFRTIVTDHPAIDGLLSPDGAWLVLLWQDGKIAAYPTHGSDAPKTWSTGIMPSSYLFLPTGQLLVDRTLWDVPTARAVHTFDTDFDVLNGIAANGGHVATAGADTTIRGYNLADWKPLFVNRDMLMEPFGIAYTPDGSRLVVGGADYRVTVLDAATGRRIMLSSPLKDYVNDIVPLAAKDWVAVQFADARTASPGYWRLLSLSSGDMRDVCGKNALVRFNSTDAWCFTLDKRTLKMEREPLPHG